MTYFLAEKGGATKFVYRSIPSASLWLIPTALWIKSINEVNRQHETPNRAQRHHPVQLRVLSLW
jgi:hypothetical protein